ncbi:molybdenum cofactor guanylyltransferase [Thalassotalea litorea]|uniref:molybdenum cofactor guanylyltransferase n=1 Tax=Thalassotalea litorea TaxID=2020715 RepID=UPI003736657D
MHPSSILGVVLAGGKSQRMGQDKSRLPALLSTHSAKADVNVAAQPTSSMMQYSASLLEQAGINDIVISGKSQHQGIADYIPFAGPLMGLYSIIQTRQPKAILALPVDMPLLSAAEVKQIKIAGELSGKCTCFADHPLPLYLPINVQVQSFLNQHYQRLVTNPETKGPSFKQLFEQSGVNSLRSEFPKRLENTNTPEQWQRAQQTAREIESTSRFHQYIS